MQSTPQYPYKRTGALLVLGSASCLPDDFMAAREMFPDASVMGINEAAGYTLCDYVVTSHIEQMPRFRLLQERKFGGGCEYHASNEREAPAFPGIDYLWTMLSRATSAFAGVLIGRAIGHDMIVMCGCPMTGSGYYAETNPGNKSDPRLGFMLETDRILRYYRHNFEMESRGMTGIYSMSGFTKEVLGSPEYVHG